MSTGRAELSIFSDFGAHGPMPLGKHESRLLRQLARLGSPLAPLCPALKPLRLAAVLARSASGPARPWGNAEVL